MESVTEISMYHNIYKLQLGLKDIAVNYSFP